MRSAANLTWPRAQASQAGARRAKALLDARLPVRYVLRQFQVSIEVRPRPVGVGLEVQQRRGRAPQRIEMSRACGGLLLPERDDPFVLADVVPLAVVDITQCPVVQGVELEQAPEGCVCPPAVS